PGEPAADAVAHRARLVPVAVLRDPALDPEQAHRRDRALRVDRRARFPALAGHFARPLRGLPAALPAVLLDLPPRHYRAGLPRLATARRRLRDRGADSYRLLFRALPDHPAAAWVDREAAAAADQHH